MKLSRSPYDRRRRSALPIIPIALLVILALFIGFMWVRGGARPQTHVEKQIPAERLGH